MVVATRDTSERDRQPPPAVRLSTEIVDLTTLLAWLLADRYFGLGGRAKMRSVFFFITLLIGTQWCEAASAAVSTKHAIEQYENGDVYTKVFIHAISLDLAWTNAELENFGTKQIYCEPRGSAISLDQRVGMLKRFVDRFPDMNNFPVDLVLMAAMKDALPCDN